MTLGPTHLAQIAISVGDVDRAKAFYRDTMGLTHLFDAPPGLSFFRCGATRLMLSEAENGQSGQPSILYYSVTSARAAERELRSNGVAIVEPAHAIAQVEGKQVWLAACRDSEGNFFGLMSEE